MEQKLSKRDRKLYNKQIEHRQHALQQASVVGAFLTVGWLFITYLIPPELGIYTMCIALLFGLGSWITRKMSGGHDETNNNHH